MELAMEAILAMRRRDRRRRRPASCKESVERTLMR
jgi:hypothetical protein